MNVIKFKWDNAPAGIILFAIIGIAILLFYGPIFTIHALNTLFGTEIPVNFWTWLSVFWLHLVINRSSSKD